MYFVSCILHTVILQIRILRGREVKRLGQGHKARKWHHKIQTQSYQNPEPVSVGHNTLQWGKQILALILNWLLSVSHSSISFLQPASNAMYHLCF